jgi:1-acyl-sn-glycerol-3-phosphate acyltransferase
MAQVAGTITGKRAAPFARGLYERIAFGFALLVFGVAGLTYTVAGSVLKFLLPRRIGCAFGQGAASLAFRGFLGLLHLLGLARFDLRALDALRGGPPVVIAPNHPTYLDAMLLLSRLPRAVCVMKREILDNPFLGGGARFAGYIPGDAPKAMIRTAVATLRAGQHVIFFPEGTRTVQEPVNAFRTGFAPIARQAGVPVQTVIIETDTRYMRKGWPLLRRPEFPLVYRVRLGKRFAPRDDSKALVAEVEAYFRAELARTTRDDE